MSAVEEIARCGLNCKVHPRPDTVSSRRLVFLSARKLADASCHTESWSFMNFLSSFTGPEFCFYRRAWSAAAMRLYSDSKFGVNTPLPMVFPISAGVQ